MMPIVLMQLLFYYILNWDRVHLIPHSNECAMIVLTFDWTNWTHTHIHTKKSCPEGTLVMTNLPHQWRNRCDSTHQQRWTHQKKEKKKNDCCFSFSFPWNNIYNFYSLPHSVLCMLMFCPHQPSAKIAFTCNWQRNNGNLLHRVYISCMMYVIHAMLLESSNGSHVARIDWEEAIPKT